MDIPRSPAVAKQKKVRRIIFGVAALLVGVLVTVGLAQLEPAAPTVEPAPMLAASIVEKIRPGPSRRLATKKSGAPRTRRPIQSPSAISARE